MSDDSKRVTTGAPPAVDESQIIAERRAKLAALRTQGNPFPNDFRRDALAGELHARYDAKSNEELEPLGITVSVAGRMMLKRVMGKASFATLQDMTGRIQHQILRSTFDYPEIGLLGEHALASGGDLVRPAALLRRERAHPAAAIQRDSRAAFVTTMRILGFPSEER